MKKGVLQDSIVVGIIVLFVGASILPSTLGTIKEKTVSTGFGSRGYIQGLIDNASTGDTIYIPNGTYYENIIINKSISLVGEDKNTTIIDGGGYGFVVSIVIDLVNISRFTIRNSSGAGISLSGNSSSITNNTIINNGGGCYGAGISLSGNNSIISDNTLTNNGACNGYGITLSGNHNMIFDNTIRETHGFLSTAGLSLSGDNNFISANTIIKNYHTGVVLSGKNNTISGNIITNNSRCGISVSGYNNTIFDNTISDSEYGMNLNSPSSDNILSNNSFFKSGLSISGVNVWSTSVMNNTVNGRPLVYMEEDSDLIIDEEVGQLILVNCTNITVRNQEIFNTTVGIQLVKSNVCTLLDNTLINNILSINLGGDNNTIISNIITNCKYDCIRLEDYSNNNTLINNTLTNVANYYGTGVNLQGSDYNTIINNTFMLNTRGIRVNGENNTISYNTFTDDVNGIVLDGLNNTFSNNIITHNCESGIYLKGEKNTISDNIITDNKNGIYLDDSNNNNIINNTIKNSNNYGIGLYHAHSNTISRNTITNSDYGITIRFSSDNIISNNSFFNSGLYISDDTILNNNVMNNTVNNKPLVCLYDKSELAIDNDAGQIILVNCTNITVRNQDIFNTTVGIQLVRSNTCIISDNTIARNNKDGIHLTGGSNTISANTITNNHYGINLTWDNYYNIISGNIVVNNDYGIGVHAYYDTIINNTITDNNFFGILIYHVSKLNKIINNTIINNGDGIYLTHSCESNDIFNNTITQNRMGIGFDSCDLNNIFNNTITNNEFGINLTRYSSSNIIYHNNLISNNQNAYDTDENTWYSEEFSEGNYWSDYIGDDLNGDGIGDTPYDIPGGTNQDFYPFMEPNGWLKEPDFKKAFIFGKITNLIATEEYITFEAVKTRVITLKPLGVYLYVSSETCIISDYFIGRIIISPRSTRIIALCEIMIRV